MENWYWYMAFMSFATQSLSCCTNIIFCFSLSAFWDRVSLCRLGSPGTHFLDKVSLELTDVHLLLPVSSIIKSVCHHYLAHSLFLKHLWEFKPWPFTPVPIWPSARLCGWLSSKWDQQRNDLPVAMESAHSHMFSSTPSSIFLSYMSNPHSMRRELGLKSVQLLTEWEEKKTYLWLKKKTCLIDIKYEKNI